METKAEDWLDNLIAYTLIAFAFLLPLIWARGVIYPFSTPKFTLLLLVTIVVSISSALRLLWGGTLPRIGMIQVAVTVYVGWAGLSVIVSDYPLTSLVGRANLTEGLISVVCYGVLFVVSSFVAWEGRKLRHLVVGLMLSASMASAVSVLQFLKQDTLLTAIGLRGMAQFGRVFGTLGNPVYFGVFAVVCILPVFAFYLESESLLASMGAGFLFCLLLFLVLVSFTRAAWVGLAAGLIFTLVGLGKNLISMKRIKILALIGVVLLTVTLTVFVTLLPVGKSGSVGQRATSTFQFGKGTVATRLLIWQTSLKMMAERPLVGWGPGEFQVGYDKYCSARSVFLEPLVAGDAHNLILNIGATLGLPNLTFFLFLLLFLVTQGLRRAKAATRVGSLLLMGVLGAVVGYLVWAQFNPSMVSVTSLFWLLAGVVASEGTAKKKRDKSVVSASSKAGISVLAILIGILMLTFPVCYFLADVYALQAVVRQSEQDYLHSVRLNPYQMSYRLKMGAFYLKRAERTKNRQWLDKAIATYQEALATSPELNVYIDLAAAHMSRGELFGDFSGYREAIPYLKEAQKLRPLSAIVASNLGYSYFRLNQYDKALPQLEWAARVPPPTADSYYWLAGTYQKLNQNKKALRAYQKVLELDPDDSRAKEAITKLQD